MTREIPGWEPIEAGAPNAQQIVNGQWYFPVFGCDSLQMTLDELALSWISVEDELPESYKRVFGYTAEFREVSEIVVYREASERWFSISAGDFVTVTHWRPLPPPPGLMP